MTTSLGKAKVGKLNREHPYYQKSKDTWHAYDLLFRGGADFQLDAGRFLVKRPKEAQDVYLERVKRVTYQNILSQALGYYQSKLFTQEPQIEIRKAGATEVMADGAVKQFFNDFEANCDRAGGTFVELFKQVFLDLLLFRDCWICVDLPRDDGTAKTLLDQKQQGIVDSTGAPKPYVMRYDPRNVINWQVDEFGNFDWVVVRYQTEEQQFLGPQKTITYWHYYDRKEFRVYRLESEESDPALATAQTILPVDSRQDERDADLVDQGPHALASFNRVPIRYLSLPQGLWLTNRAYLPAVAHFNLENSLLWAMMMANMPIPVIKSESDYKPLIAEVGLIQLRPGDEFGWTEPTGNSFEISKAVLGELREEIFRSMWLMAQGKDSSATASSASGYSKSLDIQPSREVCSQFEKLMIAFMQIILGDVANAGRRDGLEFDVRGFKTFDLSTVIQECETGQFVESLEIPSETLRRYVYKRIAHAYMSDANPGLKQVSDQEIDDAPTLDDIAQQELAAQKSMMATSANNRTLARIADSGQKAA